MFYFLLARTARAQPQQNEHLCLPKAEIKCGLLLYPNAGIDSGPDVSLSLSPSLAHRCSKWACCRYCRDKIKGLNTLCASPGVIQNVVQKPPDLEFGSKLQAQITNFVKTHTHTHKRTHAHTHLHPHTDRQGKQTRSVVQGAGRWGMRIGSPLHSTVHVPYVLKWGPFQIIFVLGLAKAVSDLPPNICTHIQTGL